MRKETSAPTVAKSLHEVIRTAKLLGISEIGHQIDPTKITAEALQATEQNLNLAIQEFNATYLSMVTAEFTSELTAQLNPTEAAHA